MKEEDRDDFWKTCPFCRFCHKGDYWFELSCIRFDKKVLALDTCDTFISMEMEEKLRNQRLKNLGKLSIWNMESIA